MGSVGKVLGSTRNTTWTTTNHGPFKGLRYSLDIVLNTDLLRRLSKRGCINSLYFLQQQPQRASNMCRRDNNLTISSRFEMHLL